MLSHPFRSVGELVLERAVALDLLIAPGAEALCAEHFPARGPKQEPKATGTENVLLVLNYDTRFRDVQASAF